MLTKEHSNRVVAIHYSSKESKTVGGQMSIGQDVKLLESVAFDPIREDKAKTTQFSGKFTASGRRRSIFFSSQSESQFSKREEIFDVNRLPHHVLR